MNRLLAPLPALLLVSACAFIDKGTPPARPAAFPYHAEKDIAGGLRRVVMMPLRVERPTLNDSARILEQSLQRAISHRNLFEMLPVADKDLADTNIDSARSRGTFHTEDLITLSKRFGADGVLHGVVTHFQAYPQVVIGLRLTLLDCRTGRVPWATDVLLDASSRIIEQDVHNFYDTHRWEENSLWDHEKVLISPRLFGEYASERVASTLATALKGGMNRPAVHKP